MESIRVLFVHLEIYRKWEHEPLALHIRQPLMEGGCPGHIKVIDHVCQMPSTMSGDHDWTSEFLSIFESIQRYQPHVIFLTHGWCYLPPDLLNLFRQNGAKVISVLWDTKLHMEPVELQILECSDYVLNLESVTNYLAMRYHSEHHLGRKYQSVGYFAGHHLPKSLFRHEPREKCHHVTLLGSNEGVRASIGQTLGEELPKRGIHYFQGGGSVQAERRGPSPEFLGFQDYLETIWKSEILLSTQTVEHRVQMKGKVLEYLACGGFCLVDRNIEYELFFPPGTIAYYENTIESLIERIEYYHARPEERRAIADRGYAWFRANFSSSGFFWVSLIDHVAAGRSLPPNPLVDRHYQTLCDYKSQFDLAQFRVRTDLIRQVANLF